MVDEVREKCEDAGGSKTWIHDDLGSVEAWEWDGPAGQLQVSLDPVLGVNWVLHADGTGEIMAGDLESLEHLKRLIDWLEIGGEIPES